MLKQTNKKNDTKQSTKAEIFRRHTMPSFKKHFGKNMSKWLLMNVGMNISLFLWGSALWLYGSNARTWEPDDTVRPTGPYLTNRTYAEAFKDAYWPYVDGKYLPDYHWYLNMAFVITAAVLSLGKYARRTIKGYNADKKLALQSAKARSAVMAEIENLAKQHNLDATPSKEILNVIPEIIQHMPSEARVYFDTLQRGEVDVNDKTFIDMAAGVMCDHLATHPEDAEKVMQVFAKKRTRSNTMETYMENSKKR